MSVPWKSFVTPVVELGYPKFSKVDKKYNDYRTQIITDELTARALKGAMRDYAVEVYGPVAGKKAKLPSFKEDEEQPGTYKLTVSSTRKPAVVDSSGSEPIPENIIIGGGSKAKLSLIFKPYAEGATLGNGVKVMLDAVMIVELQEYKGANSNPAAAFKDHAESGGFRVEKKAGRQEALDDVVDDLNDEPLDDDDEFDEADI